MRLFRCALNEINKQTPNKGRVCLCGVLASGVMGNQIDKVLPGLYVGGILGQDRKQKLQENNITHVLSIHDNAEPEYTDLFTYKCFKVSDMSSSDLSVYFSECVDFIHDCRINGGSVFIHCAAGISRSVTITVMYMMTVSEKNFEECLMAVRACREVANPNFGFRLQLKQYEEGKMREERKRVLVDYPNTPALEDDGSIAHLVTVAREKGRGSSDDPYSKMQPGSLSGGRVVGGRGASGGVAGKKSKECDEKTEKVAKETSKSKKGFFGIFS